MKKTLWKTEKDSETVIGGKKYTTGDSGVTMLCSLVCAQLGRHPHLAACRSVSGACQTDREASHTTVTLPGSRGTMECDWITHKLFWERTGMFT